MNALMIDARKPPLVIPPRLPPALPIGRSMQNEGPFVMMGMVPFGIVAVELIVGLVLFLISVIFMATIFFSFVALFIGYIALWLFGATSLVGVGLGGLASLASWRHPVGLATSLAGLLLNAAVLGSVGYCLGRIHGIW